MSFYDFLLESQKEDIQKAQEAIKGSCSLLLLTDKGVYSARDRHGRTPVIIREKERNCAAILETCTFPNFGFEITKCIAQVLRNTKL